MSKIMKERQKLIILVMLLAICFTAMNYWIIYIVAEPFEGFVASGKPIFFMVPFAFSAYLCFGIVLVSSILYLYKKDIKYDLYLVSAAETSVLIAGLTILIGMIWAYIEWGYFWQWEPRETVTLIMWLAYTGLLVFRGMLDEKDHEKRATLSAAFGIAVAPSVPLTYFIQGALHYEGGSVLGGGLGPGLGPVLMANFVFIGLLTLILIYFTYKTNKIGFKLKKIRSAKMAE